VILAIPLYFYITHDVCDNTSSHFDVVSRTSMGKCEYKKNRIIRNPLFTKWCRRCCGKIIFSVTFHLSIVTHISTP